MDEDDEYSSIKKSSLKLKGHNKKKSKPKSSSDKASGSRRNHLTYEERDARHEDAEEHGGWWRVTRFEHIKEDVAIELSTPGCYAKALGNGMIVTGPPHPPGEEPDEEEIFTAIPASSDHIAFKSGYGKYLTVDSNDRLMGLSEAVGMKESFSAVFEDNKLAICAYNDRFLTPDKQSGDRPILAKSETAGPFELVNIRIQHDAVLEDARKNKEMNFEFAVHDSEIGDTKKYLGRPSDSLTDDEKRLLKKARVDGRLNEAALEIREKYKSDKYCK